MSLLLAFFSLTCYSSPLSSVFHLSFFHVYSLVYFTWGDWGRSRGPRRSLVGCTPTGNRTSIRQGVGESGALMGRGRDVLAGGAVLPVIDVYVGSG